MRLQGFNAHRQKKAADAKAAEIRKEANLKVKRDNENEAKTLRNIMASPQISKNKANDALQYYQQRDPGQQMNDQNFNIEAYINLQNLNNQTNTESNLAASNQATGSQAQDANSIGSHESQSNPIQNEQFHSLNKLNKLNLKSQLNADLGDLGTIDRFADKSRFKNNNQESQINDRLNPEPHLGIVGLQNHVQEEMLGLDYTMSSMVSRPNSVENSEQKEKVASNLRKLNLTNSYENIDAPPPSYVSKGDQKLSKTAACDSVSKSKASDVTTKSGIRKKPTIHLAEEEFFVHGRVLKDQVPRSLCCLTNKNKVRKWSVWLMQWRWFDNIIMALIVANSVCMGAFDYIDEDAPRNVLLNQLSDVFSILFTIEAVIKIIALGFIFGKNTYLRDAWNVIDFFIVITALLQFGLEYIGGNFISLKSLRVLRILRPLKGIKTIPSLRKQVAALLRSVMGLVNVSVFLLFIFILFGIMGLQWFSGSIFYACRVTSAPIPGELVWEKSPLATEAVCSTSGGTNDYSTISGYQCPTNTFCGSPLDHGLSLEDDGVYDNAAIQFGRASFTNIFDSILAVFQIITNDSWTLIIYNLMNSEGMALPVTFGVSLIFLGTWFLLNLMLAVIMGEYIEGEQEQAEIDRKKAIAEKEELERRIKEKPQMNEFSRLNTLIQARHEQNLQYNINNHFQMKIDQMMAQHYETQSLKSVKDGGVSVVDENDHIELDKALLDDQSPGGYVSPDRRGSALKAMKSGFSLAVRKEAISVQENYDQDETQKSPIRLQQPRNEQIIVNQDHQDPKSDLDQVEMNQQDEVELNALEAMNIIRLDMNAKDESSVKLSKIRNNTAGKSSLMSRIESSLSTKYAVHIDEISRLNMRIKTISDPEALSLLTGIHSRVVAAVNIENLEDKITAVDQIRAEKNNMMMKFESALQERYKDTHQTLYGFKDEEQTIKLMKGNIHQTLSNYTKTNNEIQPKANNPFAAVFALRMQEENKRHSIDDHDKEIKEGIASGKLHSRSQLKLVMGIKRQFEMELQQKELMKMVGSAFRTIAEERASMEDIAEEYEELMDLGINETRAQKSVIYQKALELSSSKFFTFFISFAILANTIVLGLDQYPNNAQNILLSDFFNWLFYFIFLLEMIIRQTATGFKMYFKDEFNTFDCIVVAVSTIDIMLQWFAKSNTTGYDAIQALRVFRLLRVFKLAKVWPEFNYILKTVFTTLKKVAPFSVLVLIVAFSYTILGLETFSRQLSFDTQGRPVPDDYENGLENMKGTIPDWNFNNFYDAFICVFIVIANDGWSTIYYDHVRSMSWFRPTFFFVSLIIIGQYILFQLFLAILLQEFNERSIVEAATVKIHEEQNKKSQRQLIKEWIMAKIKKMCSFCFHDLKDKDASISEENQPPSLENSKNAMLKDKNEEGDSKSHEPDDQQGGGSEMDESDDSSSSEEKSDDNLDPNDISMWVLKTNNPLRRMMITISKAKAFENIIILLIILSSIQLTLENPLLDPHGLQANVLKYCDLIMTILFTFEVLFKVIAHGFLLNGKNSYLRNPWNILDFIIVVISLISVSIPDESSNSLATFKVIRMARLLRPIRVISKNDGLKISIQALYVSVPAILNLLVIVLLFMVIFGIVGVNLFKGKYEYCDIGSLDVIHLSQKQLKAVIIDDFDCYNYGGTWSKYTTAFDNILESFEQMIAQACTVGWANVMYKAMNSNGPNLQPGSKTNYGISLFFCAYIIFGAYFMANLFVGVVISSFNRETEKLGKHFLLTDEQKKWIETKLLVVRISPKHANKKPKHWIRALVFDIVEHVYFEYFILVCIVLNTIVLAIYGVDVPKKYIEWTEFANFAFSIVFLFEAILKLIAFGSRYFRDNWNVFDFVIVVGSLIFIVLKYGFRFQFISSATQVIRALRIGRILKLFRNLKQLQVIFRTFLTTLPALMNVGCLMFLIQYIFAVIGMNLFAQIKVKAPMHRWLNFQTVPNSLLTLLRVATGESWNDLMYALGEGYSIKNQCIDNPSYDDYVQALKNPVGCGSWWLSNAYFYFYILLVSLIFLNIFIAIILQGYFQTQEMEQQELNSAILENFRDAWSKFDPDASKFIDINYFSDLMFALGQPLGWDKSYRNKKKKQALFFKLISMNMQTYSHQSLLFFSDVLDNITLFYVIRKEVKAEMVEQGIEMNSDDEEDNDSSYEYDSEEEGESELSEQHSGGGRSDSDDDGRPPKRKQSKSSSSSDLEAVKEVVNWSDPKQAIIETMQPTAIQSPIPNIQILSEIDDQGLKKTVKTKKETPADENGLATGSVIPSPKGPSSPMSNTSQKSQKKKEADDDGTDISTKIDLKMNKRTLKKKKVQPHEHAHPQYDALLEKALIDKKKAEQNTDVNLVRDLQKKQQRKQSKLIAKQDSDKVNLSELLSQGHTLTDSNKNSKYHKLPNKLRKDIQSEKAVKSQTQNKLQSKLVLKTAATIMPNQMNIVDESSGSQLGFTPKDKYADRTLTSDQESDGTLHQKTPKARAFKSHVIQSDLNSLTSSQERHNEDSLHEEESSIDSQEDMNQFADRESLDKIQNDVELLSFATSVKSDRGSPSGQKDQDYKAGVEVIEEVDEMIEDEISKINRESRPSPYQSKAKTLERANIGPSVKDRRNPPLKNVNTERKSSQNLAQLDLSDLSSSALVKAELDLQQSPEEQKKNKTKKLPSLIVVDSVSFENQDKKQVNKEINDRKASQFSDVQFESD